MVERRSGSGWKLRWLLRLNGVIRQTPRESECRQETYGDCTHYSVEVSMPVEELSRGEEGHQQLFERASGLPAANVKPDC